MIFYLQILLDRLPRPCHCLRMVKSNTTNEDKMNNETYYSDRPEHHRGRPIRVTAEELVDAVYEDGPWGGPEGIDRAAFFAAAFDCLDVEPATEMEGDSYDLCRSVLGFYVWALIPDHKYNTRTHTAYRACQHFSHIEHETASARWFEERACGLY